MIEFDSNTNELFPKQAEYKKLGDMLVRTKGTKITASQMQLLHKENGAIRVFAGGKTYADVNYGDIPTRDINEVPSIIVKSRGIIEFEYYDKPFSHKNEFWSYHCVKNEICLKFVYYYLVGNIGYFQQIANKMQMPQISIPVTDNFRIPCPPLPIQEEIVRILDTFTNTVAELEAEQSARVRQYEHYRNELLSFDSNSRIMEKLLAAFCPDGVQFVKLGEIAPPSRGVRVIRSQLALEGRYPVYQNSLTPLGYHEESNCPANTPFIISAGAAGEVGYSSVEFWAADDCFYFICPENLQNRFLYHALMGQREFLYSRVRRSSVPRLARSVIEGIKIPLPPLEVQEKIVSILDRFDTLVNDLKSGLPAEIALRRKQYEYYRDKLLTFPQKQPPL